MKKIEEFRGIHSGRTFILGNGPSLTDHDLTKLQEPTFGVNRSFKAHRSDYLVASDELTFREHWGEMREGCDVFAAEGRYPVEYRGKVVSMPNLGDAIGWSWDLAEGVYPRFSTYVAMQLAVYMGFTDIVLLGTDLSARGKANVAQGHFWSKGPQDAPFIGDVAFQRECFGYAAGVLEVARLDAVAAVVSMVEEGLDSLGVRVRIVSDACPLRCWETVKFKEVT
jgi:hypothetical protein